MNNKDERTLGCLVSISLYFIISIGVARCSDSIVSAQRLSPELLLARTAVREAGLEAYTLDDTSAIHAVIAFRAEHIYRTSYSRSVLRATNRAPLDAITHPRPWIVGLVPDGRRPARWPRRAGSWSERRQHWLRTYEHSRRVWRGEIVHNCRVPGGESESVTPHDWGNADDARRMRREYPEAIELDCGETGNFFFRFPQYVRAFE